MAWLTVPLSDILVQKTKRIPVDPGKQYKQITVRLWGKGLILRGLCDGSEIAAENQVEAKAGDFLISKIDARHGAFGLVPEELDGAVVSNDFPCFNVNSSRVKPRYLDWFSKTDAFVSLCRRSSAGSTNRARLKESHFLSLEIPLPPLEEQAAIARQLDEVQARLNERRASLEAVERDTDAMLFNVFKEIVDGVEWLPLAEVAPLVRRPVDVKLEGEYPELGVRSFGKGTFHKPTLSGVDVGSKRLFEIHEGDLLFNIVFAWEGAVAVPGPVDHKRVGSHRFLTCVPNPEIATAEFLCYYLLTKEGLHKIGEASPGGAGRNRTLGVKKVEQMPVPVPSAEVQRRFVRLCAYVERIRSIRKSTAEDSKALVPSLLNGIFERRGMPDRQISSSPNANLNSSPVVQSVDAEAPLKEAVLVGAIVRAFYRDGSQPLGNFRLQKAVYFARRHMGDRSLDQEFLRKAAGPYNPTMRYSGGVKIAQAKNWIDRANGKFGEGTVLGSRATEMDKWIEMHQFGRVAAWVHDKFKFRRNDQWELLATVDYAMLALEHEGTDPTPTRILSFIEGDEEWRPKVENLRLSESVIQNAIVELQSLFADGI